MKVATEREFKTNTSRYLGGREDVVVTRSGAPIAVLTPVTARSADQYLRGMRRALAGAGITKTMALKMLGEVRAGRREGRS
ncbi:MAG: hypothetical protein AAB152_05230 [Candidatus Coatesbacteria bacterium]